MLLHCSLYHITSFTCNHPRHPPTSIRLLVSLLLETRQAEASKFKFGSFGFLSLPPLHARRQLRVSSAHHLANTPNNDTDNQLPVALFTAEEPLLKAPRGASHTHHGCRSSKRCQWTREEPRSKRQHSEIRSTQQTIEPTGRTHSFPPKDKMFCLVC